MHIKNFLIGLALLCPAAWAQPVMDPSLNRTLQPGDQLEINIFSVPELEKKFQIRADGTFFHPLAGDIPAAGKTLSQLQALLRQRLSKELRLPNFRLGLTTMAELDCAVLGEVRSQGKFKLSPGGSVMDLLALAGGISDKADLDGAAILRGGNSIPIDLSPKGQAQLSKTPVQKGDILYVNRGRRIGVSGEVQSKGIYVVSTKSINPVEDAVKAAGGATESGALNRVQIIRPSLAKPIEVNLLDPSAAAKIALEDGDTVMLPARRAVVLGAVSKPGLTNLVGEATLLDVISSAGLSKPKLDSIVVVRSKDVVSGSTQKEIYNMEESFQEGKGIVNTLVQDGDVVYVPAQDENKGFLNNLSGMASILYLARSMFAF